MVFGLGHLAVAELVPVDERHLGHMAGATTTAWDDGILRILVEVIRIDASLARLALQVRPGIGAPGKRPVAEDVRKGEVNLRLVRCRIGLQYLVGPFAIGHLHLLLVHFHRHRSSEHRTLVRIGADDHVHVVVLAPLIEFVLVVGDHITIDHRPEQSLRAVNDGLERNLAQFLHVLRLQFLLESHALRFRSLHGADARVAASCLRDGPERATALADGTTEQALAKWRSTEDAHRDASCRFARNRHLVRISTEGSDVVVNPLKCHDLVHQAIVARDAPLALLAEVGMYHKAKRTQSVFDADIYDTLIHETLLCARVRTARESSTMDHHKHRQTFVLALGRSLDAQVEAVLAHPLVIAALGRLWRTCAPFISFINTFPWAFAHRCLPAKFTHRCLGIRNLFVEGMSFVHHAFNLTLGHSRAQQLCLCRKCHRHCDHRSKQCFLHN